MHKEFRVLQKETVERTVISISLPVNDRDKLKKLAVKHDMTASALVVEWIRKFYDEELSDNEG